MTASAGASERERAARRFQAPANGRVRVGEIQRARILVAMTELVRERGAGGVSVAHVVVRSGVSRRTFYELFEDREGCFLAAFDLAIDKASESVLPAYRGAGDWRVRVRAGLEAMLIFLDAEPLMGYLCVVGALGGGDRALARRAETVEALVNAVHEGRLEGKAARRPERLVAEGVVGAVLAVVHSRLMERSSKPLLGLLNPLMSMIALPYLGLAVADRELKQPAPRARKRAHTRADPLRELDMRLTYRTMRVLLAIASQPAASNRQVAIAAGVADQGQMSKLLSRLHALGLIQNTGGDRARGEPNAWSLTPRGEDITQTIQTQTQGRTD